MRLTKKCNMTNNQLFQGKEILLVYYYISSFVALRSLRHTKQ